MEIFVCGSIKHRKKWAKNIHIGSIRVNMRCCKSCFPFCWGCSPLWYWHGFLFPLISGFGGLFIIISSVIETVQKCIGQEWIYPVFYQCPPAQQNHLLNQRPCWQTYRLLFSWLSCCFFPAISLSPSYGPMDWDHDAILCGRTPAAGSFFLVWKLLSQGWISGPFSGCIPAECRFPCGGTVLLYFGKLAPIGPGCNMSFISLVLLPECFACILYKAHEPVGSVRNIPFAEGVPALREICVG